MGQRISVDISDAQYEKILEQAKEEVRSELTDEALRKYLESNKNLNITEALSIFGLGKKVDKLKEKKVGDLRDNDKITLAIYWLMYEELYSHGRSLT